MKAIIPLSLLCLLSGRQQAQDATFSQFSATPLFFNPAFAGSVKNPRLALAYRNQFKGMFHTGYTSYDQVVQAMHGGVGILASNDYAGHSLNKFHGGLVYAPKFMLSEKLSISPGITLAYMRTSISFNKIKAPPGIVYGIDSSAYTPSNNLDVVSGFVLNTKNFYAGFAAHHLNTPEIRMLDGSEVGSVPIKLVAQTGYTIQKTETSDFSASFNLMYQVQAAFDFFQTNLTFRYKHLLAGIGSINANRYIGMLGYHSKSLVIGYSYDYFVNMQHFGATHEISLRCFFKRKEKKEKDPDPANEP